MIRRTCALLFALILVSPLIAQTPPPMPQFGHVVVVVDENQNYDSIIGSAAMPYLNGLANQYGLATNSFGNTHPSIGNYFMMSTGETVSNDDSFGCAVTVDNLVRQFAVAGKTWKVYAESLPSAGYTGGDTGAYSKHHNPFAYFSDVLNSATQKQNIVPFTQFSSDVSSGNLPNFSFVIPNLQNDAHDCPGGVATCTLNDKLANADQWLQTNIAPLIPTATFQQDGLLIITFDEADKSDPTNGGGKIATVVVSPKAKPAYRSATLYQHQHLLRTILTALGMNAFLGASKYVGDMGEFFQVAGTGSISGMVTDSGTGLPIAGAKVSGPATTTTDATGTYALASVPAGIYALTAAAPGYQSASATVTVSDATPVTQNFALTKASLPTTGSLSGRVTSAVDGRNIAGVTLSYSGGSTSTDSAGLYSFAAVAAGTYTVTATRTGWGTAKQNVTIAAGSPATLNFQLATSGQIKGTVTRNGSPVAGATVIIAGGAISTTKTLTTSATGAYNSTWIPVGNYTVTAQSGASSKTQNVTLGTGQTLTVNSSLP